MGNKDDITAELQIVSNSDSVKVTLRDAYYKINTTDVKSFNYDRFNKGKSDEYYKLHGNVDFNGNKSCPYENYFYPNFSPTQIKNHFYIGDVKDITYFDVIFTKPTDNKNIVYFEVLYNKYNGYPKYYWGDYVLPQNRIEKTSNTEYKIYSDDTYYGRIEYDAVSNKYTSYCLYDVASKTVPSYNLAIISSCGMAASLYDTYVYNGDFDKDILKVDIESLSNCMNSFYPE